MKLENIKTGFYTDGTSLFSQAYGKVTIWVKGEDERLMDSAGLLFAKTGNRNAVYHGDKSIEVSKVKTGMTFCNGEIIVVDGNRVEVNRVSMINPKYKDETLLSFDGYAERRAVVNQRNDLV